MHKFLVCACKSQDFGQSQNKFVLSHDRETINFRNSAMVLTACCKLFFMFIVYCLLLQTWQDTVTHQTPQFRSLLVTFLVLLYQTWVLFCKVAYITL